jgi:hypothetical protein
MRAGAEEAGYTGPRAVPLQEQVLPRPQDLSRTANFSTVQILLVRATIRYAVGKSFTTSFGEG